MVLTANTLDLTLKVLGTNRIIRLEPGSGSGGCIVEMSQNNKTSSAYATDAIAAGESGVPNVATVRQLLTTLSVAQFEFTGNTVATPLTQNVPAVLAYPNVVVAETFDRNSDWKVTLTAPLRFTYTGATAKAFKVSFVVELISFGGNNRSMKFWVYKNGVQGSIGFTCNTHSDRPTVLSAVGLVGMTTDDYIEPWIENIETNDGALVPSLRVIVEEV